MASLSAFAAKTIPRIVFCSGSTAVDQEAEPLFEAQRFEGSWGLTLVVERLEHACEPEGREAF